MRLLVIVACISCGLVAQDIPPAVTSHMTCAAQPVRFAQWYEQTRLSQGEPYLAETKRKQRILENYAKLKLHMPMEDVEKLFGKADFGSARPPMHLATQTEPSDRRCRTDLAYVFKKTGGSNTNCAPSKLKLFQSCSHVKPEVL